jgi:hypothetical protein
MVLALHLGAPEVVNITSIPAIERGALSLVCGVGRGKVTLQCYGAENTGKGVGVWLWVGNGVYIPGTSVSILSSVAKDVPLWIVLVHPA